jgi:hypothetical protein
MRIPVLERIRLKYAVAFAALVFVVQQAEGTKVEFSVLFAAYIIISCIAFNAAKGFIYPSGAFVFFNATLSAIFGLVYKLFLFEPGESNLKDPITTMRMYCVGMLVIWLVALINRRIVPKRPLLADVALGEDTKTAAVGALILGTFLQVLAFFPQEPGSFLAAIRQVNYFGTLAILLATFYEVRRSGGRRSSNWIVWTAVGSSVILGGVIGTSKAGFLVAPLTWLLAAVFAGYNFKRRQILLLLGGAAFFQAFLVPYSQIVRATRTGESFSSDFANARDNIFNLPKLRQQFLAQQDEIVNDVRADEPHLYDRPQGFVDRLSILGPDDALIAYTDEGNYEGLFPTYMAFLNVIPHFIWKNKPFYYAGNEYAREVGIIADEDTGTGISFSPAADAYHQIGYYGVFLIFSILLLLFFVMDSISGDQRLYPWGIVFTVFESHSANEGMIVNQIYVATYVAGGVVGVALVTKYVLPVVTGILTNANRARMSASRVTAPRLGPGPLHQSPPTDAKRTAV